MAPSQEEVDRMCQWFAETQGQLSPYCSLSSSASGVHAKANEDVPAKDVTVICSCPLELSLSYRNLLPKDHAEYKSELRHLDSALVSKLLDHLPPWAVSWFVLVEQRLLGSKSFWNPYIQCLPEEGELSTPMWFSDEELSLLEGTNLHAATLLRQQQWKEVWKEGTSILQSEGIDTHEYTWPLFKWSATMYTSRAFSSAHFYPEEESNAMLFPVMDSFNHSPHLSVSWTYNDGAFTFGIKNHELKQGAEICNNYDPKSTEELLLGYGFCLPNNNRDVLAIAMKAPNAPLLSRMRAAYPGQFEEWHEQPATFQLRGPDYFDGLFADDSNTLSGVQPELLRLFQEKYEFDSRCSEATMPRRKEFGSMRELTKALALKRSRMKAIDTAKSRNEENVKVYIDGQLAIIDSISANYRRITTQATVDSRNIQKRRPFDPPSGLITAGDLSAAMFFYKPKFFEGLRQTLEDTLGSKLVGVLIAQDLEDNAFITILAWLHLHSDQIVDSPWKRKVAIQEYLEDLMETYPLTVLPTRYEDPACEDGVKEFSAFCAAFPERPAAESVKWALWVFMNEAFEMDIEISAAEGTRMPEKFAMYVGLAKSRD